MEMMTTAAPAFDQAMRRALAPVGPAEPGVLQGDGTYTRIREALREDDPTLPRGIWERPLKRAEPAHAAELALDALETRAKDAHVGAWLVEAWVRMHGFGGARHGLWLMARLAEKHWDDLHPLPTPDDPEARDRAFERLARELPQAVRMVPLTDAGDRAYGWHDWQAALERQRRGVRDDGPLPDEVLEAVASTPTPFYEAAARELGGAVQAVDALQALLGERVAAAPPSLAGPRRTLAEIHAWVLDQLSSRGVLAQEETPSAAGESPEAGAAEGAGQAPAPAPGRVPVARPVHVGSRAEAYRLLEAAADFLARTEPHSPVPLLVRRAVAWGKLDLGGLVAELTRDGYDPQSLRTLLGLAGEERR